MPSAKDLRRAAATLRRVTEATARLPGEAPADATLRDRLDLASQVLDATARAPRPR